MTKMLSIVVGVSTERMSGTVVHRSLMAGQVAVSATAKTKAAPSTGLPSFQFKLGNAWWGSVHGVVVVVVVVAIAVLIVIEVVDDLGCDIVVVVLVHEAW